VLTKHLSEHYRRVRKSPRNGVTNVVGKQKYNVEKKAPLEYSTWIRFWRTDERNT